MKHRLQAVVTLLLLGLTGSAAALGVGQLEKSSGFNERFEARIPLRSATAEEISSLRVRLADQEAFKRANIDRSVVLNQLRFELVEPPTGADYIRVTSEEPIREPYLNFLLELRWASGRLYREYTVLLDPPLYEPGQRVASQAPSSSRSEPATRSTRSPSESRSITGRARKTYSGGSYGPVQAGQTLSEIATIMRPDSSVTQEQMMLALLRANPEVFINDNINLIRQGAVLDMPTRDQMQALNPSAAVAEVQRHHDLWEDARQAVAAAPTQRPETVSAPTAATGARGDATATDEAGTETEDTAAAESESRLKLVGAEQGTANQQGGTAAGNEAELDRKLSLALENLESMEQENTELRDRLAENEALIEDLKRLIELKDEELAALQGRTAAESAETAGDPQAASATEPGPSGEAGQPEFRRFEHEVIYPNGEPADTTDDFAGSSPAQPSGPVPEFRQFEHEVIYPEDSAFQADTVAASETGTGLATGPQPEFRRFEHEVIYPNGQPVTATGDVADTSTARPSGSVPEFRRFEHEVIHPESTAADEPAAEALPAEPAQPTESPAASADIMGTLGGYFASARAFIMNNLVLVGGVLLALLLLFMGGRLLARRRSEAEEQAHPMDADDFPDFATTPPAAAGTSAFIDDDDGYGYEDRDDAHREVDDQTASAEVAEGTVGEATLTGVPPSMAESEKEDEDPLAEVNVLMAYENFDQAEDLVRQAIEREPKNVDYHAKLLEVFYVANNRKKYETAARDLHNLTNGEGEQWDMAVAMWQEISPNRALFEAGADDESETDRATGGIVDITGRPEDGGTRDLDFNVLDSTTPASQESEGHLLELTNHDDSSEGEILNITGETEASDGEVMDPTTAGAEMDDSLPDTTTTTDEFSGMDDTEELRRAPQSVSADDDALDFSLEEKDDSEDTNLLDVSRDYEFLSDDNSDVLDVTAPGSDKGAVADDEDTALDFSLGDDRESSLTAANLDLELEQDSETDLNDDGSLDQISEQLNRLEETLGSLARQEANTLDRGTTSDALDGIDEALDEVNETSRSPAQQSDSEADDTSIDLEVLSGENLDRDSDDTEFEAGDETYNLDSRADREDQPLDFDFNDDSDDQLTELDIEIDESGTGEVEQDDESSAEEDLALDTIKMDAVKLDPIDHGFELELADDEDDAFDDMDMDATVELPKNKPDEDALTSNYEAITDDGEGEPLYPAGGDYHAHSQEDELTTKLDLAKAYVELGDSASARTILEEVMHSGNDTQKREAGELLQQLS